MAQPIVAFYNANSSATVGRWDIGEVDANSESPVLDVVVWNNKGGTEVVSDMQDVSVTCLDGTGGDTAKMITERWMKVLVDTTAEKDTNGTKKFSAIGGVDARPMRAQGVLAAQGNIIKGTINSGVMAEAQENHAKATFKVGVPLNAPAGKHDFHIRTQYFYT
jgi:hypothetical protein